MKELFTLFMAIFFVSSAAHADLLCAKRKAAVKNGKVNLGAAVKTVSDATCPKGFALVKDLGNGKDPQILAFASINETGAVRTFGGNGVTGATAVVDASGGDATFFRVTFTGTFAGLSATAEAANSDKLLVLSTPLNDNYGGTSGGVTSAKGDEIKIATALWKTDDLSVSPQKGVYVAVLRGN